MRPSRRGRSRRQLGRALPWLTPSLLGLGLFFVAPAVAVVVLATQRWNLVDEPEWVGLQPLLEVGGDAVFWNAVVLTIVLAALVTPVQLAIGLGIARTVAAVPRAAGPLRIVLLLPWALAPLVVGVVARWVFAPSSGVVSQLAGRRVDWIADPLLAPVIVAVVLLWQSTGFAALVYSAALRTIPADLRAAAALDGADAWTVLVRIDLPLLRRTTLFLSVTAVTQAFGLYDLIVPLTGGGPGRATTTVSFLIVQTAWQQFDIGTAAAMAIVTVVLLSTIVAGLVRLLPDPTR